MRYRGSKGKNNYLLISLFQAIYQKGAFPKMVYLTCLPFPFLVHLLHNLQQSSRRGNIFPTFCGGRRLLWGTKQKTLDHFLRWFIIPQQPCWGNGASHQCRRRSTRSKKLRSVVGDSGPLRSTPKINTRLSKTLYNLPPKYHRC